MLLSYYARGMNLSSVLFVKTAYKLKLMWLFKLDLGNAYYYGSKVNVFRGDC